MSVSPLAEYLKELSKPHNKVSLWVWCRWFFNSSPSLYCVCCRVHVELLRSLPGAVHHVAEGGVGEWSWPRCTALSGACVFLMSCTVLLSLGAKNSYTLHFAIQYSLFQARDGHVSRDRLGQWHMSLIINNAQWMMWVAVGMFYCDVNR